VVTPARALSCFTTIFENNVVHFGQGKLKGAVNGYRPNKTIDSSCLQSREVWPGTTYGLAAAMILEGGRTEEFHKGAGSPRLESKYFEGEELTSEEGRELFRMAMETAKGIFDAGWTEYGYWYTTPEGWEVDGSYRSKGYMRPLCVWAMQSAIDKSIFLD
jgi:non-lysosomal glucosylceramidase